MNLVDREFALHRPFLPHPAVSVQRPGQDLRLRHRPLAQANSSGLPVSGWLLLLLGGSLEVFG